MARYNKTFKQLAMSLTCHCIVFLGVKAQNKPELNATRYILFAQMDT
jgi:hypothetical protein